MTPETLTRLIARMQHSKDCASRAMWSPVRDVIVGACDCGLDADLALLRGIGAQVAQLEARLTNSAIALDSALASLASVTAEREKLAWDVEDAHAHRIAAQSRADAAEAQLAALSQGHDKR